MMRVTPDYVLNEISFANLMLYSAAMPVYNTEKDTWDDKLDANNPKNFSKYNDKEIYIR